MPIITIVILFSNYLGMTINMDKMVGDEDFACGQTATPQHSPTSVRSRIADWFFTPALAPIMQQRSFLIVLAVLAIVQIGLTAAGWRSWPCPIYSVSGVPCPGCGLSRATTLLLQGHWQAALGMHVFAPILLSAVVLFAVTASMPRRLQQNVLLHVAQIERRSGMIIILLLAIFIYWGLRLAGVIESYLP